MGTWGIHTFDDDAACDWLYRLEDEPAVEVMKNSLEAALGDEFLDRDVGMEALCACEALALVFGVPSASLPDNLSELLGDVETTRVTHLLPKALTVLASLTGERSELNDLWRENKTDYPRWLQHIADLCDRLSRAAHGSAPS